MTAAYFGLFCKAVASIIWKALDENSISSLCFIYQGIFRGTVTESSKQMVLGALLAQRVGLVLEMSMSVNHVPKA